MIEQPRLLALVGGNIGRKPPYSQWKQCFALFSSFPYTKHHQTIEGYIVDTFREIEKKQLIIRIVEAKKTKRFDKVGHNQLMNVCLPT